MYTEKYIICHKLGLESIFYEEKYTTFNKLGLRLIVYDEKYITNIRIHPKPKVFILIKLLPLLKAVTTIIFFNQG